MAYIAKIGGIIFRHVATPLRLNGRPLFCVERNRDDLIEISVELSDAQGRPIAAIVKNELKINDPAEYVGFSTPTRITLVGTKDRRIWCDIQLTKTPEYEFSFSCITYTDTGDPLVLHPNRLKLLSVNDGTPPNLSALTLTTSVQGNGTALVVRKHNGVRQPGTSGGFNMLEKCYLLDIVIENFETGVHVLTK